MREVHLVEDQEKRLFLVLCSGCIQKQVEDFGGLVNRQIDLGSDLLRLRQTEVIHKAEHVAVVTPISADGNECEPL